MGPLAGTFQLTNNRRCPPQDIGVGTEPVLANSSANHCRSEFEAAIAEGASRGVSSGARVGGTHCVHSPECVGVQAGQKGVTHSAGYCGFRWAKTICAEDSKTLPQPSGVAERKKKGRIRGYLRPASSNPCRNIAAGARFRLDYLGAFVPG